MLGTGVKMNTVLLGSIITVLGVAGLATGIGIEANKTAIKNQRISDLNKDIDLTNKVTDEINVNPPSGFIN